MIPGTDPGVAHIPDTKADDWYAPDRHAQFLLGRSLHGAEAAVASAALAELGRLVPTVIELLVVAADRHPPRLHQYNRRGERIDEVESILPTTR
ncbi:hypothetical protein [Mycolicibacter senuensis]|uniref:Adaptive response protein AidB N-terminal domain-containing protein n=1 Tax=Mycolicibacter senuensis TaxID=386913 RepID=A0A7I9XLC0_9MYCO|nr:hypothetical protein [Mycolicibacter senuensis]MDQ2629021.1 hypothetical protein [Actinomycetota bacterium]GFG70755.1 hypothetical protein MSEN_24750 [Mycolicibacter senuensis]